MRLTVLKISIITICTFGILFYALFELAEENSNCEDCGLSVWLLKEVFEEKEIDDRSKDYNDPFEGDLITNVVGYKKGKHLGFISREFLKSNPLLGEGGIYPPWGREKNYIVIKSDNKVIGVLGIVRDNSDSLEVVEFDFEATDFIKIKGSILIRNEPWRKHLEELLYNSENS